MRTSYRDTFLMGLLVCQTALAQTVLKPDNQSWADLSRHGIELEVQGKFNEAKPVLHEALTAAERLSNGSCILPAASNHLADIHQTLTKFDEAERFYLRSIALAEKLTRCHESTRIKPLLGLALLYLQDGRYGKAERLRAERLRASVFSIVGAVKDNPDETLQVQFGWPSGWRRSAGMGRQSRCIVRRCQLRRNFRMLFPEVCCSITLAPCAFGRDALSKAPHISNAALRCLNNVVARATRS